MRTRGIIIIICTLFSVNNKLNVDHIPLIDVIQVASLVLRPIYFLWQKRMENFCSFLLFHWGPCEANKTRACHAKKIIVHQAWMRNYLHYSTPRPNCLIYVLARAYKEKRACSYNGIFHITNGRGRMSKNRQDLLHTHFMHRMLWDYSLSPRLQLNPGGRLAKYSISCWLISNMMHIYTVYVASCMPSSLYTPLVSLVNECNKY